MYSILVAHDREYNIGLNNKLIFHYKKDIEHFKNLTTITKDKEKINAIIMGRKTYESIPLKFRPLKNRLNIIMSKNIDNINKLKSNNELIIKSSIESVINYIKKNKNIERAFVIGGEQIYTLFLNYNIINDLYITKVDNDFIGDSKFNITNLNNYKLIKCEDILDTNILDNTNDDLDLLSINHYTYNNKEENNYLRVVKKILCNGINKDDRTGIGTKSIFGQCFRYNVRNGMLPLFTTKRVFFRGIVEELLWFLSGSTNVKKLQEKNVHIWDGNSTRQFLDKRGLYHLKEGDIGACFPKDTLVLTLNGYKKIQNIKLNEKLYTHQGEWGDINNLQKTIYIGRIYLFKIKYFSELIKCTNNHPILIKENNSIDPRWCRAENIKKNYFMGFKKNTQNIIPKKINNIEILFVIGYIYNFVKNIDLNNLIPINIKNVDKEFVLKKFNTIINKVEKDNKDTTLYRLHINDLPILKEFKDNIPEWVQDLPELYIKEFVNGYRMANYINEKKSYDKIKISSYSNALSMQRLYIKLNIYINITSNYYIICKKITSIYEHMDYDYVWFPIEKITINDTLHTEVYNFEVDIDNSYTVQNISVHNSYGHQLRHFNAKYKNCETDYTGKGIDQIQYVLDLIKTNPNSRRIMFSYWNPEQLDQTALPSCHLLYQFYVDVNKNEISLKFDQRSCDTFHGLPFNIVSATLLLNIICYLTDYSPGEIFHTISDMHIYSSHIYECNTIINREPTIFPKIKINPSGKHIKKIEDFSYEDFELINYYPQSSVKAPMAV